jgi:xanthine dehydrogenase accessory factor
MNDEIYLKINEILKTGDSAALCTIMASSGSAPRHEGTKMLVLEDGSFMGTVGGGEVEELVYQEAFDTILTQKNKVLKYSMVDPKRGDPGVCGGTVEIFVEPILPNPKVIVIGGGHVGKAIIRLAKYLGFRVAVSDDREEFCTPEANPDADEFYPVPMKDLVSHTKITATTYIILATRGSNVDVAGLAPLLDTPAAFIGVIGSKRRWAFTRKGLLEQGVTEENLLKIHSPVGLELNAETPEEIAVSIMAEIIMLRNGGSGNVMNDK